MLLLKGEAQNLLSLINLLCNLGIIPDGNLSRHCTENPLECPNMPGSTCHSLKLRAIWRMKCQLQECHAKKLVDGNSKLPLCGSETYTHTSGNFFLKSSYFSSVSHTQCPCVPPSKFTHLLKNTNIITVSKVSYLPH